MRTPRTKHKIDFIRDERSGGTCLKSKKAKHQDRGRKKKKKKKERRLKKERKGGGETERKIWVCDVIFKSGFVFIVYILG